MTGPITLPGSGTVPAAVAALQAAIRVALPAPDPDVEVPDAVDVFDGPAQGRPWSPRSVTVAAAFEDDQDAIAVDRMQSGAAGLVTESIDVACSAYVGSGEADDEALDEHRDTMGAILTAIDEHLRADPTLGDKVARAFLSSATWLQGRDQQGAGVMVGFVVTLTVLS